MDDDLRNLMAVDGVVEQAMEKLRAAATELIDAISTPWSGLPARFASAVVDQFLYVFLTGEDGEELLKDRLSITVGALALSREIVKLDEEARTVWA